ncbi:DUF4129 domain-containing protein [Natronorubrum halophilum]|uniref:DUF4129 domain-containing protein n=1 Tax=Natronorubrum halophilum TaxID=1702106 RepID=UPI001EE90135|nr:DUF4129 domain-containing protein [Natronorubrum halophilum]
MTESNPLVRLVVVVGAIVAIALAAATVRSPLETDPGGTGGGAGGDGGAGQPPPATGDGGVPPFLEVLAAIVIALLALALVWYLLAHRREAVKLIAIGLVVLVVAVALGYVLVEVLSLFGSEAEVPSEPPGVGNGSEPPGDGGSSGDGDDSPVSTGPLFAVLAVVTAIFLGGLFLSRSADDSGVLGSGSTEAEAEAPTETTAAVGTAAGAAADRLEDAADFDNAVYRAWREMTQPLEVDRPDSSTPREFARAAVDAGMDREHVDELTRLFEDVRYGDASTTAEREERAIAVLRRIETEYADSTGQQLREEAAAGSATDVERRRGEDE